MYLNSVELEYTMPQAKFQDHRSSGSGEDNFKGFYHIWEWRPSWSCNLEHLYKLCSLLSKEASHKN